jgi:uncharacterized protein GlcG (DUF336 family)
MIQKRVIVFAVVSLFIAGFVSSTWAEGRSNCDGLPSQSDLKNALVAAVEAEATSGSSGLQLNMWGTIVARDGTVCAVAFSGGSAGAQWLGSRVISAQKANTANSFSLDSSAKSGARLTSSGAPNGLALSTANLYSAVQPGGSLFGLQESNPVDPEAAYGGNSGQYGTANDPLVGNKVGGVNVFGGGLGLYARGEQLIGGVGVSGDTSCEDHMVAWRVRNNLQLDHLGSVGGVSGDAHRPDNIIYDITPNPSGGTGNSAGGFGHPKCINTGNQNGLPAVQP